MKITQKFVDKISKLSNNFQKDTSEVVVNIVLQRDLYKKSKQYKNKVNELFDMYVNNYVTVATYLYNDFGVKELKLNGSKTDLLQEMNLHQQIKKILKPNTKVKVLDKINYNKTIKRWWILSTILQNYDELLDCLRKKSKSDYYRNIDVVIEKLNLARDDYLIEDFSIVM